eukprot:scaffold22696_cov118-Cylindrotheca_fusiformis.AAC.12
MAGVSPSHKCTGDPVPNQTHILSTLSHVLFFGDCRYVSKAVLAEIDWPKIHVSRLGNYTVTATSSVGSTFFFSELPMTHGKRTDASVSSVQKNPEWQISGTISHWSSVAFAPSVYKVKSSLVDLKLYCGVSLLLSLYAERKCSTSTESSLNGYGQHFSPVEGVASLLNGRGSLVPANVPCNILHAILLSTVVVYSHEDWCEWESPADAIVIMKNLSSLLLFALLRSSGILVSGSSIRSSSLPPKSTTEHLEDMHAFPSSSASIYLLRRRSLQQWQGFPNGLVE